MRTSAWNIQTVLTHRPLGLVFDIDGTLSPIAPTPDEAQLYPGVVALLEEARKHAHVAIITGRSVEDGAAMVNVDGLTYIGTHGLEWCDGLPSSHPVQIEPQALTYVEPGKYLLDLAEKELVGVPGIIIQRKRVGGSIHYRLYPNPEQARQKILSLLEEPARSVNMRLSEGKRVIEIKTPLTINKGQALHRFVQSFGLQGVIFAGDDRTDLDAILEIPRLRTAPIHTAMAPIRPDVLTRPGNDASASTASQSARTSSNEAAPLPLHGQPGRTENDAGASNESPRLTAATQSGSVKGEGGIAAISIVVQHTDTLPALLEHGDIVVQGVEGMVDLLREIVQSLMEIDNQMR